MNNEQLEQCKAALREDARRLCGLGTDKVGTHYADCPCSVLRVIEGLEREFAVMQADNPHPVVSRLTAERNSYRDALAEARRDTARLDTAERLMRDATAIYCHTGVFVIETRNGVLADCSNLREAIDAAMKGEVDDDRA